MFFFGLKHLPCTEGALHRWELHGVGEDKRLETVRNISVLGECPAPFEGYHVENYAESPQKTRSGMDYVAWNMVVAKEFGSFGEQERELLEYLASRRDDQEPEWNWQCTILSGEMLDRMNAAASLAEAR